MSAVSCSQPVSLMAQFARCRFWAEMKQGYLADLNGRSDSSACEGVDSLLPTRAHTLEFRANFGKRFEAADTLCSKGVSRRGEIERGGRAVHNL